MSSHNSSRVIKIYCRIESRRVSTGVGIKSSGAVASVGLSRLKSKCRRVTRLTIILFKSVSSQYFINRYPRMWLLGKGSGGRKKGKYFRQSSCRGIKRGRNFLFGNYLNTWASLDKIWYYILSSIWTRFIEKNIDMMWENLDVVLRANISRDIVLWKLGWNFSSQSSTFNVFVAVDPSVYANYQRHECFLFNLNFK